MVKVTLDAGHGGTDPGAVNGKLREKDLTLAISLKIAKKLRKAGIKVVETRTTDKSVSLAERVRIANQAKSDLFVSVHINSFGDPKANGVETYSFPNSTKGSAKLSKAVQDELVKTKLFKANRGTKTANFYVLRNTPMTAILTELGFIKNPHDIEVMKNKQDELAQAVVNGILNYTGKGGSKPVKPSKPSTPKPKPTPSTPSKKSTATIAKEVIAGKWGNGADRKKRLEKAGYNFNTIQREVNKQLGVGGTSKPKPKQKSTDQLAKEVIDGKHGTGNARKKSLGSRYNEVQRRVNQMLGAGGTSKPKPKPKKTNKQIALEIYRGQGNWGTGKTRQDRLRKAGYNPSAVQREVNKLF